MTLCHLVQLRKECKWLLALTGGSYFQQHFQGSLLDPGGERDVVRGLSDFESVHWDDIRHPWAWRSNSHAIVRPTLLIKHHQRPRYTTINCGHMDLRVSIPEFH